MKRQEFISQLERSGCVLSRHGSKHDIYLNHKNGKKQPVPRHTEIEETLVRHIKKYLDIV
ncbi:type II toxin-antitoxin system HicA family toxin [Desulfobacca acetoxidans]|uniref:YcfA family protein n=1 Tax=Desulfobacca acetoxidans (strain ATCC 700848 / DSM 11109 / ASRB2) TaxID=880072 RepID=F2NJI7_DESAR|nr:YcfA family protein [Desulfobacca acetoxidans DSM 11109]